MPLNGADERPPPLVDLTAPRWQGMYSSPAVRMEPTHHPAFDRMMANVPEEITQTFSDQQLVALSLASIPRVSPHVIDYRVSIPFFGKRYYLTVLAGRERRSRARLAREGQLMSGQVARLDATVLGVALAFGLIALAFGLYIVKSALGIDLFEGNSAMHEVFRQLNVQPPL